MRGIVFVLIIMIETDLCVCPVVYSFVNPIQIMNHGYPSPSPFAQACTPIENRYKKVLSINLNIMYQKNIYMAIVILEK